MSKLSPPQIAALHLLPSITAGILRRAVSAGDLTYPPSAAQWSGLGAEPPRVGRLMTESENIETDKVVEALRRDRVQVLTSADPAYPVLLGEIPSPPPVLYVRGDIKTLSTNSLAVVGTRQPTAYGLDMTKKLVEPVAQSGITIVSGLAYGIDGAAHDAARRSGGLTVAVLGSGIGRIYPPEHRQLAEDIIARGGAVISEFPLGAEPARHHFPQRNRIISGLTKAVLLIEAGAKSGALITAKFAVDQNREVLAIPGLITTPQAVGPHNWLKLGAKLVTSAEDILEVFSMAAGPAAAPAAVTTDDPVEAALIKILAAGPVHIDEIVRQSRLDTSVVMTTISLLEIRGLVQHLGGMHYALT